MSEVIEGQGPLKAGNTTVSLAAPAALPDESIDLTATEATDSGAVETPVSNTDDVFDAENTFDVSRAEFSELQDAFTRLIGRITKYNTGASHRI